VHFSPGKTFETEFNGEYDGVVIVLLYSKKFQTEMRREGGLLDASG
jgi:hypothetical protein